MLFLFDVRVVGVRGGYFEFFVLFKVPKELLNGFVLEDCKAQQLVPP